MKHLSAAVLSAPVVALAAAGVAWWDADAKSERDPTRERCEMALSHERHIGHLVSAHRAFSGPGLRTTDEACNT